TTEGEANYRPRWSPDSRTIAYISERSGKPQIWLMDSGGTRPRRLTSLATGADGVQFSPDGQSVVFTSEVYPNCLTEACNQRELDAEEASKTKARLYDSLLYRHWNSWRGERRTHLFTVRLDGGVPRDLTPGGRD